MKYSRFEEKSPFYFANNDYYNFKNWQLCF